MLLEELKSQKLHTECFYKTSRSSGKGGQNVNKLETKVELLFHVEESSILSQEQKIRLLLKLATKLDKHGYLHLISENHRTQLRNKGTVIENFYELIAKSLKKEMPRKPTKPTKASKEKRKTGKTKRSEVKNSRKKIN